MPRVAMVSSTVLDLPEHRVQVRDACLRAGFHPKMQEYGHAADRTAIEVSLRMVEEADVYLGILGTRYGTVPDGAAASITEYEYDRAVQLDKQRLLFLMDPGQYENHYKNVEFDAVKKSRLDALRGRMESDHVAGYYKDARDLFNHVVASLNDLARGAAPELHAVTDAPAPPDAYVAHPYTLLQTQDLVGRQAELNLLTEWVSADADSARVVVIEAVGGMGKSALTWHWFMNVAPHEMSLAGRVWWSFYETDASYENFLTRTLAYVTRRRFAEVEALPLPDREEQLLRVLDREPHLIVLDGLERLLQAYARPSASQSVDAELDRQASESGEGPALGADATASLGQQHRLRRTINPRAGMFLRRLLKLGATRVVISTRLFPTELQTDADTALPGVARHILGGLADDDAVDLWRSFQVSGARGELLELFHTFANYPLLIRVLAGEVARFRPAPRDFQAWRTHHPDFNPFDLELLQVRSHVLAFALSGLTGEQRQLLNTIAAFRAPAAYELLREMVVGPEKPYSDDVGLDRALEDLEDRGLVGWDRRSNRYDQHPIVRGVAWTALDASSKRTIHQAFERYFASLPAPAEAGSVDELYGPLQHYNSLCELGRHGEALTLFSERIFDPLVELGEWAIVVEQLSVLFAQGTGFVRGADAEENAGAHLWMAVGLQFTGQLERAIPFWRKAIAFVGDAPDNRSSALSLLSLAMIARGELADAEAAALRAVALAGRASDVSSETRAAARAALAAVRAVTGVYDEAISLLEENRGADDSVDDFLSIFSWLFRALLWQGDRTRAAAVADQARDRAAAGGPHARRAEAAAMNGALALDSGDLEKADEWLRRALDAAAAGSAVPVEVCARLDYVELERRRGRAGSARRLLVDAVELAKRGPFAQGLADAEYLRALIARDLGERDVAVAAAGESMRLAWGGGPPYAYAFGLSRARALLATLEAEEPADLPMSAAPADRNIDERIVEEEWKELARGLQSDDAQTRRQVVTVLGSVSNQQASHALLQALNDPAAEVRLAALETFRPRGEPRGTLTLAAIPDPRASVTLPQEVVRLAADPRPEIRAAALMTAAATISATASDGEEDADDPLVERIVQSWLPAEVVLQAARDVDATVRAAAAAALALLPLPDAAERLIELCRDEHPQVRAAAIAAAPAGDQRVRSLLRTALSDESPTVRVAAAARVPLCLPELEAELLACLSDPSADIRTAAVGALPFVLSDEIDRAVCALVDDPDRAVVLKVHEKLRYSSAPARIQAVARLLDHHDAAIRTEALTSAAFADRDEFVEPMIRRFTEMRRYARATAIRNIAKRSDHDSSEFLARLLQDTDPGIRAAALEAAGNRQDIALLPHVRSAVADPSDAVVQALRPALAGLGDRDVIGELLASERAAVRRVAVESLGDLGDGDAAGLLTGALADPDETVRFAAAGALTKLGLPGGHAAVVSSLQAREASVRAQAVAALAELRPPDACELITGLAGDPHPQVQEAVLQAVARLAGSDRGPVSELFAHGDARMRRLILQSRSSEMTPVERLIVAHDLDRVPPFITPDPESLRAQVDRVAGRLGLSPSEIEQRLESLAQRLGLPLGLASVPG
jgi:HEAT repeat protein